MKDRLASTISILLLIALVAGTWWAADYAKRAVVEDPPRRLTHEIDSYVENFVMVRTDLSGMPTNRVEGDRMNHYPDDDSSDIFHLKAINQRVDRPTTVVTSKTARMDEDGARIVTKGDAQFLRLGDQNRAPLQVNSEEITVLPDDDVAFTDLPATIVNGRSTIHGRGMRYDNVTRALSIAERAKVQINPAPARHAPPSQRQPSKG